jgi:hypothetical protein
MAPFLAPNWMICAHRYLAVARDASDVSQSDVGNAQQRAQESAGRA